MDPKELQRFCEKTREDQEACRSRVTSHMVRVDLTLENQKATNAIFMEKLKDVCKRVTTLERQAIWWAGLAAGCGAAIGKYLSKLL